MKDFIFSALPFVLEGIAWRYWQQIIKSENRRMSTSNNTSQWVQGLDFYWVWR